MKVPAFTPRPQDEPLLDEIKAAVNGVLDSGQYIGGPEVLALEREFADFLGLPHAVAMSSGTDALLASLMALGVGDKDEVLTTPFTFFATAGVVHRLGARPVFADIDPKTFNLDPHAVELRLKEPGRRIQALIAVHLYGQAAAMDELTSLSRDFLVPLVEDAAQAVGCRVGSDSVGHWGRFGCFSFYPTKNLGGFGDGGIVVCNEEKDAEALQVMRNHGMVRRYYHDSVGGNFRMDAMQAAALRVKLPHVSDWNAERQRLAANYTERFRGASGHPVRVPEAASPERHVFHQYVVRVPRRDELREFLQDRGVGSQVYYPVPLHLQPCFEFLGHREGDFPHAEQACRDVLALPLYPGLSESSQELVVDSVLEFYRGSGGS